MYTKVLRGSNGNRVTLPPPMSAPEGFENIYLPHWQYPAQPVVKGPSKSHSWWCHQMETYSALLAICVGNSQVTGEFPAQRPVTWSFDVFFDLCLNKRLSKHSWGWWFETPFRPLWRHCNVRFSAAMMNIIARTDWSPYNLFVSISIMLGKGTLQFYVE